MIFVFVVNIRPRYFSHSVDLMYTATFQLEDDMDKYLDGRTAGRMFQTPLNLPSLKNLPIPFKIRVSKVYDIK